MMSFLMYFCSMDNCRPTPPGGCFHPFDFPVASADLPPSFPDPFAAGPPHPLCVEAARQVMRCLDARTDWREELGRGKMFGVLPAEDEAGRVGFLVAFSGILDGSNRHEGFVPPVYDLLRPDGHFKQEEARISAINRRLDALRAGAEGDAGVAAGADALRRERHERSAALQTWLFRRFRLLNARGEAKDLIDIFAEAGRGLPPGGAGECAAPKLLQYAFLHGLRPLALAEFWYGRSPKGEPRRHGAYYPPCAGKCVPILRHMLEGLCAHVGPETEARALTLYEDELFLVVDKRADECLPACVRGLLPVCDAEPGASGLRLFAKTEAALSALRPGRGAPMLRMRYEALLDGRVASGRGFVRIAVDSLPAVTRYEVEGPAPDGRTRVMLSPLTDRRGQLRLHARHPLGLGVPIVGDGIEADRAVRLCLHLARLEFRHPATGRWIKLASCPPF